MDRLVSQKPVKSSVKHNEITNLAHRRAAPGSGVARRMAGPRTAGSTLGPRSLLEPVADAVRPAERTALRYLELHLLLYNKIMYFSYLLLIFYLSPCD